MNMQEIQRNFHSKMLEFRAVDSLLWTERFEDAYNRTTEQHRDMLVVILKSGRLEALRVWIKERLEGPLRYASYRRLRELGKRENIHRWSRLDRDELLAALEKKGLA